MNIKAMLEVRIKKMLSLCFFLVMCDFKEKGKNREFMDGFIPIFNQRMVEIISWKVSDER